MRINVKLSGLFTKKIYDLTIAMLSRLPSFMSSEFLLQVLNTIVFPHFNHCCTVWENMNNKNGLDKL